MAAVSASTVSPTPSAPSTTAHDEVIHTTTNHPWLTADHGWLPAGFLHIGEPVVTLDGNGVSATVVAVRVVPGAARMWDLTVANVHTFAVGNGANVVHTCIIVAEDAHEARCS